jgi:uncharacterized protein (DUF1800 family)
VPTAAAATVTPTLPRVGRHFARRFSGGITPTLARQIIAAGGGRKWFAKQLYPTRISDPRGDEITTWFPSLKRTPQQIFERQRDDVQGSWEVMADLNRWTVARRIHSSRQLHEIMVDFWSNLLHVPLGDDVAAFHRVAYDKTIRYYALSSFEQLLLHSTTHPAMGLFLDNATSTKAAPNENLGRELLELHTVGVDAGYTEAHVKASSRMLTGYRSDVWWPSFRTYYDPAAHWTGRIDVLGFSHANTSADGRAATTAYLKYLAHHPATANRLARRLCVRFVSDTPSASLVSAVAKAYRRNGTQIRPTLIAMVDHPEFLASAGAKVRTPIEDYVATVRALGIHISKPVDGGSFVNAMYWQYREAGQAPYEWPAPNGFPEVGAAWSSAGRVLNSLTVHRDLAARWWPTKQAVFPSLEGFLPTLPASLQTVIDHVAVRVVGQKPTSNVCDGIATVLGMRLTDSFTSAKAKEYWAVRQILASLLDSPIHMHR